MKITVKGKGGHGALMNKGSDVISQVQTLLDLSLAYRDQQLEIQKRNSVLEFGSYASLSVNMIQGGIAVNVKPTHMTLFIDVRLSVEQQVSDFQSVLNTWMSKLGKNTTLEFLRMVNTSEATVLDKSNPYWMAMKETINNLGLTIIPTVCAGTTDMLPVRGLGIPAVGFTTNRNLTIKSHDIDEYVPIQIFLDGIDIYYSLIKTLGNLPDERK